MLVILFYIAICGSAEAFFKRVSDRKLPLLVASKNIISASEKSELKLNEISENSSTQLPKTKASRKNVKSSTNKSDRRKATPLNTSSRSSSSSSSSETLLSNPYNKSGEKQSSWSDDLHKYAQQKDISQFAVTLKNLAFRNRLGNTFSIKALIMIAHLGKDHSGYLCRLIREFTETPIPLTELSDILWSLPRVGFKIRNPVRCPLSEYHCHYNLFRSTMISS